MWKLVFIRFSGEIAHKTAIQLAKLTWFPIRVLSDKLRPFRELQWLIAVFVSGFLRNPEPIDWALTQRLLLCDPFSPAVCVCDDFIFQITSYWLHCTAKKKRHKTQIEKKKNIMKNERRKKWSEKHILIPVSIHSLSQVENENDFYFNAPDTSVAMQVSTKSETLRWQNNL